VEGRHPLCRCLAVAVASDILSTQPEWQKRYEVAKRLKAAGTPTAFVEPYVPGEAPMTAQRVLDFMGTSGPWRVRPPCLANCSSRLSCARLRIHQIAWAPTTCFPTT